MLDLIGYYCSYITRYGDIRVGRIDTEYQHGYFVIDDDNYGCDTCSDHISYEDITDINICLDELNKIEDLVVDFYADEQIRYEMRFADLDSLDELLIEYKASLIKG